MSKYGVISGPYFPLFGLNTGKCGPEITQHLDTFHAVHYSQRLLSELLIFFTLLICNVWINMAWKFRLPFGRRRVLYMQIRSTVQVKVKKKLYEFYEMYTCYLIYLAWNNKYFWQWKVVLNFRFTKLLYGLKPLDNRPSETKLTCPLSASVHCI